MSNPQFVLITGCTDGGIGSAFALAFHRRGFHVFATARSVEKMSRLQDLEKMTLLPLDVTSTISIQATLDNVTKIAEGKLHYLINNSGVSYVRPMLDTDIEEARQMFDVNLWGVLAMTQAFFPLLRNAKGCVVNMGSITGVLNTPYWSKLSFSDVTKQTDGTFEACMLRQKQPFLRWAKLFAWNLPHSRCEL